MVFCWWADDGPLRVLFGSSSTHHLNKKTLSSWTPLTKLSGSAYEMPCEGLSTCMCPWCWCNGILFFSMLMMKSMINLTLKAPRKNASENVVCWSCLLQIIALHYRGIKYRSKQREPRTDCSYRSSLFWVHTVCYRAFLNISADEKSRRLLLQLAH